MIEKRLRPRHWLPVAVLGLVPAFCAAQTESSPRNPSLPAAAPTTVPDQEWNALIHPEPEAAPAASLPAAAGATKTAGADSAAALETDRQQETARLVHRADQFRAFRQKYPDDKNARQAKRQEGLLLLQAAFGGERSQGARRRQLVTELLADRNLTAAERFEVAAYAGNLTVEQRTFAASADRLAAFEEVARELAARFPDVPAGYESLLAIAKAESGDQAKALLSDLAKMPAPAPIKAQAAHWLARYALVGSSIGSLTASALGANHPIPPDRPTIIYTWSADNAWSMELAKRLASDSQAKGVTFIGVNLDADVNPARVRELAAALPGEQIAAEARAAFASALLLDEMPLVYLADRSGRLQTVTAQNQPLDRQLSASTQ
jgi:hypothetical protein